MTRGQVPPISLLHVEDKIFFRVVARRLVSYLKANSLTDISVQKAGIPCFSGCLEHSSMIWYLIQAARTEARDLRVVVLDLVNAFGSVPHSLLWKAFSYFQVLEKISALARAYYGGMQLCFSASNYTTSWQHPEIGIMAGCTISLLAFTMATEVTIRASKQVVGGERLQDAPRLRPPVTAPGNLPSELIWTT